MNVPEMLLSIALGWMLLSLGLASGFSRFNTRMRRWEGSLAERPVSGSGQTAA